MRALRATAAALAVMVAAGCGDDSKAVAVNANALTSASASLALTIGELVERYATELPTGDAAQDVERLRTIFRDGAGSLGTDAVTSSFSAAASDSREAGNDTVDTARQLVAAATLAARAFDVPRPDYKPGDQAMQAEIADDFARTGLGRLSATYGLHSGGLKLSTPGELSAALSDAAGLVLLAASYNYAGPNGSHPIRDRMRGLDMPLPPSVFVDHEGNLVLPDGEEPDDWIASFDEWRSPPKGAPWPNPLWAAVLGLDRGALMKVFEPAAEKAFG